jgi:pyrroline-5-carboxylate reductase
LAFIGGGNMAEALIAGLIRAKAWPAERLVAADVAEPRRRLLAERYGIRVLADNAAAAETAGVVVLAVKPQVMPEAAAGLRGALAPDALVLSIAAGVPTPALERWLGDGVHVIRVMPNTPTLVGCGAHAWCRGRWVNDDDARLAKTLLTAVGRAVELEERLLDAATALSGSGPAYVFYLAEAMFQAGLDMGFTPEVARLLTAATVEGAGRMLAESGDDPLTLRQRVTSKGGTTAAAASVLDQAGAQTTIVRAIRAAEARARELAAGYMDPAKT